MTIVLLLSSAFCPKEGRMEHCVCVWVRELNRRTIPDQHPFPRIQETLDSLDGNSWFSVLYQGQVYHQGFIAPQSRPYTAFMTPWGTNGYAYCSAYLMHLKNFKGIWNIASVNYVMKTPPFIWMTSSFSAGPLRNTWNTYGQYSVAFDSKVLN